MQYVIRPMKSLAIFEEAAQRGSLNQILNFLAIRELR